MTGKILVDFESYIPPAKYRKTHTTRLIFHEPSRTIFKSFHHLSLNYLPLEQQMS